jgi:hypothetical protein
MDETDRNIMSAGYGGEPIFCDAGSFTWCHRPRLYWLSWELSASDEVAVDDSGPVTQVTLVGQQHLTEVIRSGWSKVDVSRPFPTFHY